MRAQKSAEFVMLQLTPDVLNGVELGSVSRQILQLNVPFEALDAIAHQVAAMCGLSVPDH